MKDTARFFQTDNDVAGGEGRLHSREAQDLALVLSDDARDVLDVVTDPVGNLAQMLARSIGGSLAHAGCARLAASMASPTIACPEPRR